MISGTFRALFVVLALAGPMLSLATSAASQSAELPSAALQSAASQSATLQSTAAEGRLDGNTVYEGWYVIRPGDTLEGITQRYLGDSERWRENWRLNPEIKNPHLLSPGLRLRILLRSVPDEGAVLESLSNRVQDQLPPLAWQDARVRDVLRPRDSVRTFESSSAQLRFGDDTRLTVSEESLVFLDRETSTGTAPVTRDQIEIVVGQADLGGRGRGTGGEAIELVMGDAVAVPEPSAAGRVQTRARKAEAGAQLMSYEGASKLAAAGVEIDVPQGMGSAVAEGSPPGPPEALLPAPDPTAPADGARLTTPKPEIAWTRVDGAAGYVVEVCHDKSCAQLVARAEATTQQVTSPNAPAGAAPRWRPTTHLPVADLYWRVTAVSASGLDGYPSTTRAVTVVSDTEDLTPPEPDFQASGPYVPPRTGLNKTWILGPGAGLEGLATDQESGVERLEASLDGETVSAEAWLGPWQPGSHEAGLTAVDGAGNRADLAPIPFLYDITPPVFSWGVEGVGRLGAVDADPSSAADLPKHRARRILEVDDPHSFWPWRKQAWTVHHDDRQMKLTPSRPVVVHVGSHGSDDIAVLLAPGRGLWVLAADAACGPSLRLDHDLKIDAERFGGFKKRGVLTLRLDAEDCVTNRTGATLRLTTSKPDREAKEQLDGDS